MIVLNIGINDTHYHCNIVQQLCLVCNVTTLICLLSNHLTCRYSLHSDYLSEAYAGCNTSHL